MAVLALIVFLLVLAIIFGSYWFLIVVPEQRGEQAVRARLKGRRTPVLTRNLIKARERLSSVPVLEIALARWTQIAQPLQGSIAHSGLKTSVGTVVLGSVFAAVLVAALVARLTPYPAMGIVAGILAGTMPFTYVRWKAKQRIAQFEEQFPDTIDLIGRALRAGHALPTALQMVADEVAEPVRSEFRLLSDQQSFGMPLPEALRAFATRVPLLDARFFVTAVLTQREMGGNLSEVLDKLAAVIRERFKVRRHVRAVSAHGRITGVVLALMPPAVALGLSIMSPRHIRLLIEDPLGVNMVIAAIVMQCIGVLIIRRIVDVEF